MAYSVVVDGEFLLEWCESVTLIYCNMAAKCLINIYA